MPWPAKQRKAIAAWLRARGKSPEEIREFFHQHGHAGGKATVGARKPKR